MSPDDYADKVVNDLHFIDSEHFRDIARKRIAIEITQALNDAIEDLTYDMDVEDTWQSSDSMNDW